MKKKYDELLYEIKNLMENGNWNDAYIYAKEAVSRNRYNLTANYYLAACAEHIHEWLESYRYYSIAYCLSQIYKQETTSSHLSSEAIIEKIDYTMDYAANVLAKLEGVEKQEYKNKLLDVNAEDKNLENNYYMLKHDIDGFWGYHMYYGKEYFMGRYKSWFPYYSSCINGGNGTCYKSEMYQIYKQGKEVFINDEATSYPCVVPIVANLTDKLNDLTLEFTNSKRNVKFEEGYSKAYNYLRLEESVVIKTKEPVIVAKPIPLRHTTNNKKLVLNIFIDSFNYKCICDEKIKSLMPNTYEYFKKGVICTDFFSGSEYTYPSAASYWTGFRPCRHQMLDDQINFPLSEDMTLLPEIFHDNGYFTAVIGGNAIFTPQYGYTRGIDRFLYGKAESVFPVEDCVTEAIEHIKAFEETDQFLWMEIQDLHFIAGYFPMPLSLQTHLPVDLREIDNIGGSSLYQTSSPHRRRIFDEQLLRIDEQLKRIYDYLEEHYSDDEVIISIISDHGTGYNVDDGNYFTCEQRLNVPLMLRGGQFESSICSERIETIDYIHIITKLAGIEDSRLSKNDGCLPLFFGGEKNKEYVFSQSLYPNRNYSAMILGSGYKFYIQTTDVVGNDCRISLDTAIIDLRDSDDNPLEDKDILHKCLAILITELGDFKK
ncbi:MAG: sulfatase-like hydrolase/transferase [Clostridium sp.]|nr:sulfatase-like hydrolase/transferase [Clostridium sp.]MCM1207421.1 sulfatase-like hydrolase/transferase [Ruminococcus sp.]